MAFPFPSSGENREVDFNFPQEVSTTALSDLDKALKARDGQQTVDALVRYSIAQSSISADNAQEILSRIDQVVAKEKQPHIRALLYHLEALAYQGYRDSNTSRWRRRNNPADETPSDLSEWDRSQFDRKIVQLIDKSLEQPDALRQVAVTSMPDVIKCNALGAASVPTLLEFLYLKAYDMLADIDDMSPVRKNIANRWLDETRDNVPAHIYAMTQTDQDIRLEDYHKYKDSEYSALLLKHLYLSDNKDYYKLLKEYVACFPKSVFTPEIENRITEMESREVYISYPLTRSTTDSIPLTIRITNVNRYNINVYRIPDGLLDEYELPIGQLKLVASHPMTAQGQVPFTISQVKVMLPPLPCGAYVLSPDNIAMDGKAGNSSQRMHNYNVLWVSNMAIMTAIRQDGNDRIAVVDVKSGKPLPGVTVNYSGYNNIHGKMGTTDANGLISMPETYNHPTNGRMRFDNVQLRAAKGDDKYGLPLSYSRLHDNSYSSIGGNIYTDLGVYRPGETVHWASVAFTTTSEGRTPLAEKEVTVIFMDKNRQPIDTLKTVTDAYGRAEGSFVVPKDRMNGMFSITMTTHQGSYNERIAQRSVNVSEYKTPTFEVTFPDARRGYDAGQPVKVKGKAMTYSGMPVAGTTVRLSLIQDEWSWWWWRHRDNDGTHLMDTTLKTDEQGQFMFTFKPGLFSENEGYKPGRYCWSRYNYRVVATVTTDAGETHEETTSFIVGTRRGIDLGVENHNTYYNDKPIKLPLTYNTTDEDPKPVWCTWEVTPIGGTEPVKTGNLSTADPTIDLTSLPSGRYSLKVHILDAHDGEKDVDATAVITLYRKTDKVPPVKDCPLWISPLERRVDKANTGHLTIGVSVPRAHIYYMAYTTDEVVAQGWLDYRSGLHDFTVPLPKRAGADVEVQFATYWDSQSWHDMASLSNPYKAEDLKISATSFRDKLAPGDVEQWTFTLTDQNGKPVRAAMLLDMYDKAIASIAPNNWLYTNWRRTGQAGYLRPVSLSGGRTSSAYWTGTKFDIPDNDGIVAPYLFTYYQSFFGSRYSNYNMYESSSKGMLGAMPMRTEARMDGELREVTRAMKVEEVATSDQLATEAEESAIQVDEKNLDKVVLRESDVKTALWMPMLTSDDKGNVQVQFEVPNFNTTWITQAVAWNEKAVGSQWMAEVLTQKPLMVRSNMPRFLRQGDKARLAATVQNATDQAAQCDAVIELFDPSSGDIYATRKFNLQLDGNGSEAVTIDWLVPETVAMVGFRIKAANSRYGDGEQVMVPVLTTISPVIETEPFYIEAAQSHYETALPQFPADARVTLEYCDNPTWYCVLALPTIFDINYQIATRAAHSLFALQVAQGVAKSQPQIKEAVTYWKQHSEDSTLVSMLQKNQDLKIGTLLASPWVREADRQTLRMSKLGELFDDATVSREYDNIITALEKLQMSDGGFTWFIHPNCESSLWTTGAVLEIIGDIKHLGYLPDDARLNRMIERALAYYDKVSLIRLSEIKRYSKNPYGSFTDYAYTRSLFPEVKPDKASADLMKNTVKYMDKNWGKGLSLSEKAFYAMTLNRNGHQKTAHQIIESIRQFAMVKPSLGMYWDNLQRDNGWWEYDKVAYTSTILRAMNEVDPRQDEIDQVRKWMLLMKQSNDWGSYSLAADAVNSILSTGSQWLERGTTPTITVAGQPVNLDKMAQWLGYFRTTLPASTTGNVVIDRSGSGPAWGAVYSQFKAPMTQIQEKSIEEMSISKEYYLYGQDGKLRSATSFKVGDKVKVRVIIKVNKDMDYVTMTDERAACFEPVDQLSGYRSEDATWFYLETKDTQTNVFINNLSKGTHIIGYDVWVTNPGEFTSGIATIQSQYAPQLSAHSAGKTITVSTER